MEELGRLAFEGVADELENPANYEERERNLPESRKEESYWREQQRNNDQGNADGMANAIDCVLMAGRVLRDPVVPGASEEHGSSRGLSQHSMRSAPLIAAASGFAAA